MSFFPLFLVALGCGAVIVLTGKRPLSLTGRTKTKCVVCGCLLNILLLFCSGVDYTAPPLAVSRVFLVNVLFLQAATDVKEKNVYSIHFCFLLGGGLISAFFLPQSSFWEVYLIFFALLAILSLASKKREDLGGADSRTISVVALYFAFSQWVEIMITSLGIALLYGVILMVGKKQSLKTEIPFMPFLLVGVMLELL